MRSFTGFAIFSLAAASSDSISAAILTDESVSTSVGDFDLPTAAACAYAKLSGRFGDIVFPSSPKYITQAVDAYWDKRADLSPACIFPPANADEIAEPVSILSSCNSQFAVRGGGHMSVSRTPSQS